MSMPVGCLMSPHQIWPPFLMRRQISLLGNSPIMVSGLEERRMKMENGNGRMGLLGASATGNPALNNLQVMDHACRQTSSVLDFGMTDPVTAVDAAWSMFVKKTLEVLFEIGIT